MAKKNTFQFAGLDEYVKKLYNLSSFSFSMIGEAIYKGADVVANETKTALQNMEVDDRKKLQKGEMLRSINTYQKNGLIKSFGIAKLRNDSGFYNVKTGFDGYNGLITDRWPIGQPNIMIARALESGTSYMKRNPVISKATNRAKKQCEEAMKKSFEENIEKIMK